MRGLLIALRQVDQAPHRVGFRDGDWLPGEQRIERIHQVMLGRLGLLRPVRKPIVDRAAIYELPGLRIDDEDVRRAGDSERLADQLSLVHQNREIDAELGGFLRDRIAVVLQVRVDQ